MLRISQAVRVSMRRLFAAAVLVIMGITSLGVFPATPVKASGTDTLQPFDLRDHPIYLIAAYYNAITLKDYARAYSYWKRGAPDDQTLAQFTAGFADTASVRVLARLPIQFDGAAGTIHAEVPVVVFSTLNNGTQKLYAGCIHTALTDVPVGNATEPDPNWWLYSASLKPATSVDFVQAANECSLVVSFPTDGLTGNVAHPIDLLTSYYNAIASKQYTQAYGLWDGGQIPGQSLSQFSAGFAGTNEIGVVVALSFDVQGAAGSMYAPIPVLITAKDTSQSQLFVGCIVTRKSNVPVGNATEPSPDWHIYSANIHPVESMAVGMQNVWTICSEI